MALQVVIQETLLQTVLPVDRLQLMTRAGVPVMVVLEELEEPTVTPRQMVETPANQEMAEVELEVMQEVELVVVTI